MKNFLFSFLLLAITSDGLAAGVVTVSRLQFGKAWPFTREEVMLQCRQDQALFVINNSTLAQYPLNDIAEAQVKANKTLALPIAKILLDDPQQAGQKMNLEPIRQKAATLCQ